MRHPLPREIQVLDRLHPEHHIALWCRRGRAVVTTRRADREQQLELSAGEAALVPAGTTHSVALAPGAVMLPVDLAGPTAVDITATSTSVGSDLATALLWLMVAQATELRPNDRDAAALSNRVLQRLVRPAAGGLAGRLPLTASFIPWVSNSPGEHVLLWSAAGTITVSLRSSAGRTEVVTVPEGLALTVPPELEHRVVAGPGSVCVPVFTSGPTDRSPVQLHQLTPPLRHAMERQLMASTTALRPPDWDDGHLGELLADSPLRATVQDAHGAPPTPADGLRHRLLLDPGASTCVGAWLEQTGGCRRSLEREFRRTTGTSALGWLNAVRAARAAELLACGHPAQQVARRLGYSQASALTRSFKQTYGLAPRAYLKAQHQSVS